MAYITINKLKPGFCFGQSIQLEVLCISQPRELFNKKNKESKFTVLDFLLYDGKSHIEASTYHLNFENTLKENKVYDFTGFEVLSRQ